ncbi:lasso peptide biosynthesis B2 protein [Actinophytocola sp. S1-96]|uniref:Lasso peptide biosynthesis B2 protein n=2 Tax=Actinophytocola gossypii TaxID=2812003 RepID=A0ABT2JDZ4_9PSEU|nr:lasso peptide biosynthesis B2 protein [Actinophytocola gossypii]
MLRRHDLPTVCARLGIVPDLDSGDPPATGPAVLPGRARTAIRACSAATRRWRHGDTCLRRCLLVGNRLRHLSPVLRIGVRRDGDGILAHSWLEVDGRTLDPTAVDFAPLGR